VTLQSIEVRGLGDLDGAFAAMAKERTDAIVMFSNTIGYVYSRQVADLATKNRLAGMYAFREVPDAGGLMSYGPNLLAVYRRAGAYVAKILKGAKPGDLPIEQPTRFELVLNLKTAKALGLSIPPSVLARADEVIHP
jgi:ABC-type uncharacterized transport system substrate-binding protein